MKTRKIPTSLYLPIKSYSLFVCTMRKLHQLTGYTVLLYIKKMSCLYIQSQLLNIDFFMRH